MRRETLIKNLLFDVDPVPFEAVVRDCPTSVAGHLPPSRTIHCIPQLRPHDRRQSMILTSVRSISMDTDQSTLALNTVLRLPEAKPEDKKARKAPNTLTPSRLTLVSPFGPRAAVCLGSRHSPRLTDIAARPPENAYFQKDRDTIEKRSGRWLNDLARQSQTTGFDLNAWIPVRNGERLWVRSS